MIWDGSGLLYIQKMRLNLKYCCRCVLHICCEIALARLYVAVFRPRARPVTRTALHSSTLVSGMRDQDREHCSSLTAFGLTFSFWGNGGLVGKQNGVLLGHNPMWTWDQIRLLFQSQGEQNKANSTGLNKSPSVRLGGELWGKYALLFAFIQTLSKCGSSTWLRLQGTTEK